MTLMGWLRGECCCDKKPEPVVDDSPKYDQIPIYGPGVLDPRSSTWMFVSNWASEELKKAREKNDSVNKDISQTSALRGEIKILKALINLPNPKGLLVDEYV